MERALLLELLHLIPFSLIGFWEKEAVEGDREGKLNLFVIGYWLLVICGT